MSRRVLITGGAGFIGSTLGRYLQDQGHGVFVLDDLSFGRRELAGVGDERFFKVDIRDRAATARAIADIRPHWALHPRQAYTSLIRGRRSSFATTDRT